MEQALKKVLFITNIPAPYRIDFYNELGRFCDLTVIFEAKRAPGITFNWKEDSIANFKAIFLKEGNIEEKKIDWSIFKYIRCLDYDFVFITNYAYLTEMAALLSIKLRRKPYFYELDGAMAKYDEGCVKRYFKSFFLKGAKAYVSPSVVSDDYVRFYAGEKASIIRYPFTSLLDNDIIHNILSDDKKQKIREKLRIAESKMILAVGQFIPRKGFDILMQAVAGMDKNIGIYIVGGKPTPEYLEMQESLKLDNVHFEGFKTKAELAEYFKAADLFVLPTREDIWGLVINEAMAYGLPVVTTKKCVAGVELLNDKQCLVDVEDVEGLCNAMMRILEDEELKKRLAEDNLAKIKDYTIENMARVHAKILGL